MRERIEYLSFGSVTHPAPLSLSVYSSISIKLNLVRSKQHVKDSTVFRFPSVPPRWTKGLPPRKSDVIIGRNETIDCAVMADPEAAITWFKNGQPLKSSR